MRIRINVPNELVERVRQANPDANLSQLCRVALEEYAARSERAQEYALANYEEMQDVARRLVEEDELPLIPPDWTGYALEDARDWVRTVSKDEWEKFFGIYDILLEREGEDANSFADLAGRPEGVKGFRDRWHENEGLFILLMDRNIEVPQTEYRKIYNDTWVGYALKARRVYLELVSAERERVMDERRAAWKDIQVELPSSVQEESRDQR